MNIFLYTISLFIFYLLIIYKLFEDVYRKNWRNVASILIIAIFQSYIQFPGDIKKAWFLDIHISITPSTYKCHGFINLKIF